MTTIPPEAVKPIQGYPSELVGHLDENGQLPASILATVPGQAGGPAVTMCKTAMRSWVAMCADALADGIILKTTSKYDSYRPLSVQQAIFDVRYSPDPIVGQPRKNCDGKLFWLRPGYASAACPGHSNHGYGLADDIGEESDGDSGTESISQKTANWLVVNGMRFGFAAELVSEPWHWRYITGDNIPPGTLAYEEGNMPLSDEDIAKVAAATKTQVWYTKLSTAPTPTESAGTIELDGWSRIKAIELATAVQGGKLDQILAALGGGGGGGSGLTEEQVRTIVREELNKTRLSDLL